MDDGEVEDAEQARRSEVMANALRHASFGRPKRNRGAGDRVDEEGIVETSTEDAPPDPSPLG